MSRLDSRRAWGPAPAASDNAECQANRERFGDPLTRASFRARTRHWGSRGMLDATDRRALNDMARESNASGISILAIQPDTTGGGTPFTYTVGRYRQWGDPELIVVGEAPPSEMMRLCNDLTLGRDLAGDPRGRAVVFRDATADDLETYPPNFCKWFNLLFMDRNMDDGDVPVRIGHFGPPS